MLRISLVAAAVVAALLVAPTLTAPEATAEAPKCKNKANKYVACTDKLKAKTQRKKAGYLYWGERLRKEN